MNDNRRLRETLYVLYDGRCNLCLGTVERLRAMRNLQAELQYVPLQALEGEHPPDVPGRERLDPDAMRAQLHVVQADGAVYAGAEAIVRIMRAMPGLRLLSRLYAVPGLGKLADIAYRYVAKRRYDWFGTSDGGCADGACALPQRPVPAASKKDNGGTA